MKNKSLTHPKYRPDIDGLRAIAVMSVIGFHAFPEIIPGGFIGVDIFFVISGFLISTIIFQNISSNSFSLIEFYSRRIRRIFPSLIIVLTACLAFGWIDLLTQEYKQLGKHVSAGAGFVSNLVLWNESGYFDNSAETKPLLHLWSLGIEEQFYLFWPFIVLVAWKRNIKFAYVIFIVIIVSFWINISHVYNNSLYSFYSPQARFWELLIGAFLAWFVLNKINLIENKSIAFFNILSLFGVTLIVAGEYLTSRGVAFPGWYAFLPTLGSTMIIMGGMRAWINQKILSNSIVVWFGLISYPLYLWHWPLLSFENIIEGGQTSIVLRFCTVILSISLAWITYKIVESPFRYGQNGAVKTYILLALMFMLGGLGFYTFLKNGFPSHNITNSEEYFKNNNWSYTWTRSGCAKEYLQISEDCKSESNLPPTILLIGDSHSQELYPGLVELMRNSNENIMRFGTPLPFFDTAVTMGSGTPEHSSEETNKELYFAMNSSSVKTIIISFRAIIKLTGTEYEAGKPKEIKGISFRLVNNSSITDPHSMFEIAMRNTLAKLSASHKQVIFVVDTPELGFRPEQCYDMRPIRINKVTLKNPCAISRKEFDDRNYEYRSLVFSVLKDFPSVAIFDAASQLCDNQWCWAVKDGKVLYQDPDHLSMDGSRYIGQKLVMLFKR